MQSVRSFLFPDDERELRLCLCFLMFLLTVKFIQTRSLIWGLAANACHCLGHSLRSLNKTALLLSLLYPCQLLIGKYFHQSVSNIHQLSILLTPPSISRGNRGNIRNVNIGLHSKTEREKERGCNDSVESSLLDPFLSHLFGNFPIGKYLQNR